jgi:hypothetical protein
MRLPALEKNILVYRGLQMILFLFYAEELRRQLVETVGPVARRHTNSPDMKGERLLKAIFSTLVRHQVVSRKECEELQQLLDHRNAIAHKIEHLMGDIEMPGRRYGFRSYLGLRYDHSALGRMKKWREELPSRFKSKYTIVVSMGGLLFEPAERAYETQLSILKRRIDKQFTKRKAALRQS